MKTSAAFYIATSVIGGFALSLVFTKIFIPLLHKLKFGQQVRDDGPNSHLKKQGTPTMGGISIILAFTVASLTFLRGQIQNIIPIYILTLGFGLVGFFDDYVKIVKKRSLGLTALQKLIGQFLVTSVFYVYFMYTVKDPTVIQVPFLSASWDLGYLFLPFTFFAVLGTVNGANFTDGLDGLLSSVTIMVSVFFLVVSNDYSVIFSILVMIGVLLGFLMFNIHPAKVFMGDTGSLALGGFIAAVAFLTKTPLFILIVGFVYLFEILSVIIQVVYFKRTKGKRFFKMAPIHHHFELLGMEETRVVYLFTIVTLILGLIGYIGFSGL